MDYHLRQLPSNAPIFAQTDANKIPDMVAKMKEYIDYKNQPKTVMRIEKIIAPKPKYQNVPVEGHIKILEQFGKKHLYGDKTPLVNYNVKV